MQNYEKPEVILMTECSEGVYLSLIHISEPTRH